MFELFRTYFTFKLLRVWRKAQNSYLFIARIIVNSIASFSVHLCINITFLNLKFGNSLVNLKRCKYEK